MSSALTDACLQVEDSVAGPYAAGILELAQERNIVDNVYNDLMALQVCFLQHLRRMVISTACRCCRASSE